MFELIFQISTLFTTHLLLNLARVAKFKAAIAKCSQIELAKKNSFKAAFILAGWEIPAYLHHQDEKGKGSICLWIC